MIVWAFAAALASGCGSDGADRSVAATDHPSALTKPQFIRKADAICNRGMRKAQARIKISTSKGGKAASSPESVARLIILPAIQAQAEEVRALGVPDEGGKEVEQILSGIEDAVTSSLKDLSTSLSGNNPFVPLRAPARKYGFKVCWPI